jgi:hypothetical protein
VALRQRRFRELGLRSPPLQTGVIEWVRLCRLLGPVLPAFAAQQVGSYLAYSGRGGNAFGKAARDPRQTSADLPAGPFQSTHLELYDALP